MDKAAVLKELGPSVSADYPLAKLTSFKVGGPADFFAAVQNEADFVDLVRRAWVLDLPVFIMGNGSNILLADKGIRGLVIHNRCDAVRYELRDENLARAKLSPTDSNASRFTVSSLLITADAGAMLPRIAREAIKRGFHDLVYATGIPGTVGGAVLSNAGAYGWCMADDLTNVRFLARDGQVRTEPVAELGLSYRHSRFKESGEIVLGAKLCLCTQEQSDVAGDLNRKRRETQPLTMPNAGSMFKNPASAPAGLLIEQAGLKGRRQGNAQISEKHANFIVNLGGATADDVLTLIRLAQAAVAERLELEVQLVGDWGVSNDVSVRRISA